MDIIKGLFNEYNIKARIFPALLTVAPLIVLKHFILDAIFPMSLGKVIFGDISVGVVLIYFLVQVNRFVSKWFFEDRKNFPTVNLLLESSGLLSKGYRDNLTLKIRKDFNLDLPSLAEENQDPKSAKRDVNEIIRSMIHKVKGGSLLLQFNIEYGFARNLLGGSVIAVFMSVVNMVIFGLASYRQTLLTLSVAMLFSYATVIIIFRKILKNNSHEYAEVLLREYLDH